MRAKSNRRNIDPVSLRVYFLLAFTMIIVALAHVFAFEKLSATRSGPERLELLGE